MYGQNGEAAHKICQKQKNIQNLEGVIAGKSFYSGNIKIKKALERDNFMTPSEAKDFGLIDQVVEKRT